MRLLCYSLLIVASWWCASVRAVYHLESLPSNGESMYECDKGSDIVVPLATVTPIPDGVEGGTLTWPIRIASTDQPMLNQHTHHSYTDSIKVHSVSVHVRGLYHQTAGDLQIRLLHDGKSALLAGGTGSPGILESNRAYGEPQKTNYFKLNARTQGRIAHTKDFINHVVGGKGYEYQFRDVTGENWASYENVTATQSSTMNGDNTAAWRVIDGNTLSSGVATHTEENPWVQLDLGQQVSVGTIVIWTPDPENQIREVQSVTTVGLVTLGGSFRLRLNNNGVWEDSDPIAHNAVALASFEDGSGKSGVGAGESMQSKIQSMQNVGLVSVSRSDADPTGGFTWYITFLTEYTNLEQMYVAANNLTAGELRSEDDQVATIIIDTVQNGTKNTFYNQDMRFGSVILSDVDLGDGNFSTASQLSTFEKNFHVYANQRQINIPVPPGTNARYLRVTLKQESYLSISEILVYSEHTYTVNEFEGGSPIPEDTYAPEESLQNTFKGSPVVGEWYLEIQDLVQQSVGNLDSSHRNLQQHGTGVISDWVLTIQAQNELGEVFNYSTTHYVDLSASVVTLPKYGKLYISEPYQNGQLLEAKIGQEIYTTGCYDNCKHKYDIGNPLSTSPHGSVAVDNKLFTERHLIYQPHSAYAGQDQFTYRLNIGSIPQSEVGKVNIRVKKCRQQDCSNDLFARALSYDDTLS